MIIESLQTILVPALAWLMTYTVHSTLLLGAAVLVARCFADEHWWLARLWKTAMLGAVVTTTLQAGIEPEPLGGRWAVIPVDRATKTGESFDSRARTLDVTHPKPAHLDATASSVRVAKDEPALLMEPNARADSVARTLSVLSGGPWRWLLHTWPSLVVGLWVVGAAFGLARFALAHRRVRRRLLAGAQSATADIERLMIEMGQTLRLVVSRTCDVPVALPDRTIVLPHRFAELQRDEQRVALAHEIAHILRHDPEWLSLAVIVERLFYFQPLNRLARRGMTGSAEFLCDEWAVRHTGTPLALARCLATVAAWSSSATESPMGAVAMARRDSPLVRRVQRILAEPSLSPRRPSTMWLATALVAVGIVAPMFSAQIPPRLEANGQTPADEAAQPGAPDGSPDRVQDVGVAKARQEIPVVRSPNPTASLQTRWAWALSEANRRGLRDFWLVYSFRTPTHAHEVMISDSVGGSFVGGDGEVLSQGPALGDVLGDVSPSGTPGAVVVTLRFSSANGAAISRAGYRSARLRFDFQRRPVFWLGFAREIDSFRHLEQLTSSVRDEKLRILFIEAASLHPTTDLVLPFLVRLLEPSNPVAIRREAAEGFDHHHDPRSVEILLRTARQDPAEEVRAEAAETIGEVQTPESIPALKELALTSPDSSVRREAAEAFADQPADRALPALETVIASSTDDGTLGEAVEALGDIGGKRASDMLLDVAWKHTNEHARREAVETLASIEGNESLAALVHIVGKHPDAAMQAEAVESIGDKAGSAAVRELERIVRDHPNEDVQAEAIETIADVSEGLNDTIMQTARAGKNARVRREAIDTLSHAAGQTSDARSLDQIEQVLEFIIFEDADHGIRPAAMDALEELPAPRAHRVLRKIIDRHPDAPTREEAMELDQDRNR